jgi:hypothetical protein
MASTITDYTSLINVDYPALGNNDSQGFRSNFASIKSALDLTGDEITDLQLNLVTLNNTNDFGGNQIKSANLVDCNIILKNYNLSELAVITEAGSVENGSLVFVTDNYNSPAYYHNGTWYAFSGTSITLS